MSSIDQVKERWFEKPWLKCQVENHLVFGIVSRYVPLGPVLITLAALLLGLKVLSLLPDPMDKNAIQTAESLGFLGGACLVMRTSKLQQAAFGWSFIKVIFGLIAFVAFVSSLFVFFLPDNRAGLPLFLLSITWLPGPEFFKRLAPKNWLVTVGRLSISTFVIWWALESNRF